MQINNTSKNKINSQIIKKLAREVGFDLCGISPAYELLKEQKDYKKWLSFGCHGKMSYLEKNLDLRFDPSAIVENAKSVISLAVNYYPQKLQNTETYYKFSKYAYGKDYHLILKNMLSVLLGRIREINESVTGRGFVDSAPVMEKSWAQKAGLGWQGKNGCLIVPKQGSYFFLCELIVDMKLEYDKEFVKDYCGNCTRCVEYCPTGAISEEGFVNAEECISYLTIELKDSLVRGSTSPKFDNWIFGCDVCQDVCPWNKFAKPASEDVFGVNEELLDFTDEQWENITREQFLALIKKKNSPMARIKYDKLKSNIEFMKSD